jgi:hypothetical protein
MANSFIHKFGEALAGACLMAICILFRPVLRRWYSGWGSTTDELVCELPGDEYVPHRLGGYTQSIGIKAPARAIWPWIVQTGQDKAGFYSYELLENVVGCNIHNIDHIVPDFQTIIIDDKLLLHPHTPGIPVAMIEPEKALVYGGRQDEFNGNVWTFFLNEEDTQTRLIARWAFEYKPTRSNIIIYNWLLEPIAAIMQRKMLLTIKRLVER